MGLELALWALVALQADPVRRDGSAQGSPAPPVFSSGADRVLVDVVVTDKKGRPVLDLVAEDFQVFENGVRRPILSFAAFGAAALRARQAAGASQPVEAPFVQAASVLLIDDGQMTPVEAARLGPVLTEVLRGLHERGGSLHVLAPLSKVSVVGHLPEAAGALAQAIGSVRGHRPPQVTTFPMTDAEALDIEAGDPSARKRLEDRFAALNPGLGQVAEVVGIRARELANDTRRRRRDTFGALRTALGWLAAQPGRHSVILVSAGFPHDRADPEFPRVVTDSFAANAPIHLLDVGSPEPFGQFQGIQHAQALGPDSRVSSFDAYDAAAGSEQLAAQTGGLTVRGLDVRGGLERILDTTRTYYVLGYERLARQKPGFRKIKVRVARKGLDVLARRGYFDDGAGGSSKVPEKAPPRQPR